MTVNSVVLLNHHQNIYHTIPLRSNDTAGITPAPSGYRSLLKALFKLY